MIHDKCRDEEVVCISLDGSAFDSSQHWSLLRAVDVTFWKTLMYETKWLEKTLEGNKYYMPENVDLLKYNLQLPMMEKTSKLVCKFKGHKPITFKIEGTTYSGSATRTTLGNTLRQGLYVAYAISKTSLKCRMQKDDTLCDVHLLVAGDDCVIMTKKSNVDKVMAAMREFFTDNKEVKEHGLGQRVMDYVVTPWYDIDFCSKVSCLDSYGELRIFRNPAKVLPLSNFHRFCSDNDYMPKEVHSEYIATSVAYEVPGQLFKQYSKMRSQYNPEYHQKAVEIYKKLCRKKGWN